MANYTPQTSDSYPVNPQIVSALKELHKIADNNELVDEFAECFTPSGTLTVGNKRAVGRDEIAAVRKKAVAGPILKRRHRLGKVFQWGSDSNEVMEYGNIDYWLGNGKQISIEWAIRAILVEFEGKMRFDLYQNYTDWSDIVAKEAGA